MEGVDPKDWKLWELDPITGAVKFDWHAIDNFNEAFLLGVRAHMGADFGRIFWELRRQVVEQLVNGTAAQSNAVMKAAGVTMSNANKH